MITFKKLTYRAYFSILLLEEEAFLSIQLMTKTNDR
jgi:hypothetical protein